MVRMSARVFAWLALFTMVPTVDAGHAQDDFIVVASTTSTENSGLFERIVPIYVAATGIDVRVVAVGTGQALRIARNGDADVLLVHHTSSEEQFVADGFGVARYDLMYNDFVIVGPRDDPAAIAGTADAAAALAKVAAAQVTFVSRGDDSGTHKKELRLWRAASVDAAAASGTWYRELGTGMGATLNTAAAMAAYALTDRATWTNFQNRDDMAILVEGDLALFNQYGVILVNPARHPHVKAEHGQAFIDWLLSTDGQNAIGAFRVDGQQVFFPNAAVDHE